MFPKKTRVIYESKTNVHRLLVPRKILAGSDIRASKLDCLLSLTFRPLASPDLVHRSGRTHLEYASSMNGRFCRTRKAYRTTAKLAETDIVYASPLRTQQNIAFADFHLSR